ARRRRAARGGAVPPRITPGGSRSSGRSDKVRTADISTVAKMRTFLLLPDIAWGFPCLRGHAAVILSALFRRRLLGAQLMADPPYPRLPVCTRRTALQAGAVGLLGLGMNHLPGLRALAADPTAEPRARAVIYVFLSGGLSQLDSFDLKPDAPAEVRGE